MDGEVMRPTNLSDDITQEPDVPDKQVVAMSLQGIDGEEISAARMPGASVVGHGGMLCLGGMRRNALRILRPTGGPPYARCRGRRRFPHALTRYLLLIRGLTLSTTVHH